MTSIRRLTLVAAGVAALVGTTAGCSSSSHPATRSTTRPSAAQASEAPVSPRAPASTPAVATAIPDACTLLTRAEAEAVAGVKLGAGEDTKAAGSDNVASCTYNAPTTGPSGSITVFAQLDKPDALTTDQSLGHKFLTVTGVGDQALQEVLPSTIFFRKGKLWVSISSAYSAKATAMVSAARLAAARVGS
jgi:hypothetical protein